MVGFILDLFFILLVFIVGLGFSSRFSFSQGERWEWIKHDGPHNLDTPIEQYNEQRDAGREADSPAQRGDWGFGRWAMITIYWA